MLIVQRSPIADSCRTANVQLFDNQNNYAQTPDRHSTVPFLQQSREAWKDVQYIGCGVEFQVSKQRGRLVTGPCAVMLP